MRVFVTGSDEATVQVTRNVLREDKHIVEFSPQSAAVAVVMFEPNMIRPWVDAGMILGRAGVRRVLVVAPGVVWNDAKLDDLQNVFIVGSLTAARSMLILWAGDREAAGCSACQE